MTTNTPSFTLCVDARFAHDHFPGIGRVVTELCHAWAAHPTVTQLHIIRNPRHHNTFFTLPDSASHVHYHDCDTRPFGLAESWCMRNIVATIQPDWVYIPHFWHPWLPLPAPTITTIHDLIPLTAPHVPPLRRCALRWLIRRAIDHAHLVTTVSEQSAQQLRAFAPDTPIHVIPNGTRTLPGSATPIQPPPYLLCVSSNQPHKNLSTLAQAWHLGQQSGQLPDQARLVIAGRMDTRYPLPPNTTHLRVIANPSDAELATLYHHAHAFVLPSLAEGYGLPLLEAAAHQLACLCDDNVGQHDHLRSFVHTCDMQNPHHVAVALTTLWHTPRPASSVAVRDWGVPAQSYLDLMCHKKTTALV